jgi:hypothetical protein
MEVIVTTIEDAAPTRWQSKRRDFRDLSKIKDEDAAWEQFRRARTELAVAAAVITAGISCEFGIPGRANPDLVLPTLGLGLEVTRRTPKAVSHLQQTLRVALADYPDLDVHLRFDPYPARLSGAFRARLVDLVVAEAKLLDSSHQTASWTAIDGPRGRRDIPNGTIPEVRVTVALQLAGGGTVTTSGPFNESALLTPSLELIYDEVIAVIDDDGKVGQARSMPCVLVYDVMDLGLAWLGDLGSWARALQSRLPEGYPFVAVAVTACDLAAASSRYAIAVTPSADHTYDEAITHLARRMEMATGIVA